MKKRKKFAFPALLLTAALTLCGCVRTVDELYQVPRRSEGYQDLQSVMDHQLLDLEYSAPSSGDNQQAVQMADLDGDGTEEVLLFARGADDRPLKILIFAWTEEHYRLCTRIELAGTSFDQVDYVQMDGAPGLELVIGTELSDQLLRNVSVYRFEQDQAAELLNASYRKFLCVDLDENGTSDLLVIGSGEEEASRGTVRLYSAQGGKLLPRGEARLSQSVEQMKRIMTGGLSGGQQAVFVASAVDPETVVTDVFALVNGALTNVSQSGETQTSVKTLRSFYVYGDDIDNDGEMELPSLISVRQPASAPVLQNREHLIRWYAMTAGGEEVTKAYTYHNYQQMWYLTLQAQTAERISVIQESPGAYHFLMWNPEGTNTEKLWTVLVLTGEDRSAQAAKDNRFVLLKTDSVVYAAELTPQAVRLGITEEDLQKAFHLIRREWKTGEM